MNPLSILALVLPLIEKLPTVEAGVMGFVKAVHGMIAGGLDVQSVVGAVEQSLPNITQAIVANTPHAGTPEVSAAVAVGDTSQSQV